MNQFVLVTHEDGREQYYNFHYVTSFEQASDGTRIFVDSGEVSFLVKENASWIMARLLSQGKSG